MDLPSIEECVAFKAAIDTGREHAGLPPIRYLDFDGAKPGSDSNCLSARNLFWSAGYVVDATFVAARHCDFEPGESNDPGTLGILPEAVAGIRALPDVILRVTDPFDFSRDAEENKSALRARLVEAGVVEP